MKERTQGSVETEGATYASEFHGGSHVDGDADGDAELDGDGDADLEDDLGTDLRDAMRMLAAAPRVEPGAEIQAGQVVGGSFRVERRLGAGGMGIVHLAWDCELERYVALKVQRAGMRARSVRRLAREARAMAQLSHPNVMPIYAVGHHKEQLFIAMEYVDGGTAGRWLDREARTWQEILALYIAAGRGLAAAHLQGMVHRDFKPENVLVCAQGRPRVADFGLARARDASFASADGDGSSAGGDCSPSGGTTSAVSARDSADLRDRLTRTGVAVGTVAYMAPEQYAGGDVDACADQFSFCVALYEALYGKRPFPGRSGPALLAAIERGELGVPADERGVPRRVFRALRRGLSADAGARFPSMQGLLQALGRRRAPLLLGLLAVGGAAALLTLGLFVVRGDDASPPCATASDRLSQLWNPSAQLAARRALDTSGRTYAVEAFIKTDRKLVQYAAAWGLANADACEATHVRHEQSPEKLDRRVACLDRGRRAFVSLLAAVRQPDAMVTAKMVDLAYALPAVEPCSDLEALGRVARLPADPTVRGRISNIRDRLAVAQQRIHAGEAARTRAELEHLLSAAQATGYRPVVGQARYWLAKANHELAAHGVEDQMRAAFNDALAGGDDRLSVQAVTSLVRILGEAGSDAAYTWADTGWALLEKFRHDPSMAVQLLRAEASAHARARAFEPAMALLDRAGLLVEQMDAEDPLRAAIQADWGRLWGNWAKPVKAHKHLDKALRMTEASLGAGHPKTARLRVSLARTWLLRGDYSRAQQQLEGARKTLLAVYGPDSSQVAALAGDLADTYWAGGQPERALAVLPHAIQVLRASTTADRYMYADAQVMYGSLLHATGDHAQGLVVLASVAQDMSTATGEVMRYTYALRKWGAALMHSGKLDEAALRVTRSIDVLIEAGETTGVDFSAVSLGKIARRKGAWAQARPVFERAVVYLVGLEPSGAKQAQVRALLAEALFETGQAERAQQEISHAFEYVVLHEGTRTRALREELEALVAKHGAVRP